MTAGETVGAVADRAASAFPIAATIRALAAVWFLSLAATPALAQSAHWLRDAAISPDGARVAFRYKGQIWIAPTAGGDASPLTPAGFHSGSPVWSPSGDAIAFASDRFGPSNIFVAPSRGGEAKRLTWYSVDEWPFSFTPDGKSVLFASRRLGDATRTFAIPDGSDLGYQLYQVPIDGGRDVLALPNPAWGARWDRSGKHLLYTSASIEQPFRQHQLSSAARQAWVYDAASGRHERLTDGVAETRGAVWSKNGDVYYLSEASGSLNVWRMTLADRKAEQLTHFIGDPVRSLSIADNDDLAFAWRGDLFRLKAGTAGPERMHLNFLEVALEGDRASRTSQIDDFVLSPNGREIAVTTRGEIFVASMNGKYVKRVTHGAGEARAPSFARDGRALAYMAERDGHWSLYQSRIAAPDEPTFAEATTLREELIKSGEPDAMWPNYAPDGKHIAYIADRAAVRVLDVADKSEVEVLPKGQYFAWADPWPLLTAWSPDSKWLALEVEPNLWVDNVAIAPADGSRPATRVAPSGEEQWGPRWSPDGGMVLWLNDPEALREAYESEWKANIVGVHVSRAARDAFRLKLREPEVAEATAPDAAAKPSKPRARESFSFEPDGVEDREIPLSQNHAHLVYYGLLPDGTSVLQVERSLNVEGNGFVATGTIRDLRLGQSRTVFSGVAFQVIGAAPDQIDSPVQLSRDGRKLYFLSRGSETVTQGIMEVDLAKGSTRLIKIALDTTRDEAEARKSAFDQFWTLDKRKFFDTGMNGVDWDAAREKYERWLPSVADPSDLAELLSEMSGELGASHTGSFYRGAIPLAERTASLGLYYDETYPGPGMKVAAIIAGGPFDAADSALRPGDVLRQIDGEDIPDAGGVRRALSGRFNQLVAVTAEHSDGTRFTEKRVPLSLNQEFRLARERWKKRKRDDVVAKSCGRLGYVYVEGMDARSYREVFSEIFGRFGKADGLVVDERFNGGGDLHNQLLTLLSGKAYLKWTPPRGEPGMSEPRDRWAKPSAVIMNAASYSDASVFPRGYRDLKLGTLVGDPVAGTGTGTWWAESKLIPGLVYGLAELPLTGLDGKRLENDPILPDIPVLSDPTPWDKGEDPQLDAAIKALTPKEAAPCGHDR